MLSKVLSAFLTLVLEQPLPILWILRFFCQRSRSGPSILQALPLFLTLWTHRVPGNPSEAQEVQPVRSYAHSAPPSPAQVAPPSPGAGSPFWRCTIFSLHCVSQPRTLPSCSSHPLHPFFSRCLILVPTTLWLTGSLSSQQRPGLLARFLIHNEEQLRVTEGQSHWNLHKLARACTLLHRVGISYFCTCMSKW